MGQAKLRGTYEERKAAAIAKREAERQASFEKWEVEQRTGARRARIPDRATALIAMAAMLGWGRR